MKLTISPHISTQTADSFLERIQGFRSKAASKKPAKISKEISLTFSKKGQISIRIKRPKKELTELEVEGLAKEYALALPDLIALVTKRKVRILNSEGEQTNAVEPKPKTGRRKAKEADAGSGKAS